MTYNIINNNKYFEYLTCTRHAIKKNKNKKKNKNTAFLLDRADLGLSLGSGTGENF